MSSLLSPVDRDCLAGAYAEDFVTGFREALRAGIDGWVDDDLALVGPWGFALDMIRAPVFVWQAATSWCPPRTVSGWRPTSRAPLPIYYRGRATCRSRAATRTRCWMN